MASASLAAAPSTCSALSRTTSNDRSPTASARVSSTGRPGSSRTPSTAATVRATSSGPATGASSTSHTPSPEPSSNAAATCNASRVLPIPPGPVIVTSREDSTSARTAASSRSRPTNVDSWAGKLPAMMVSEPGAAASTPAAGAPPRAAASNSARGGPAKPSASASSRAVSLRAVRLIPRSRSLTDRGERLAASASSSWVSPASARSCRSSPPNPGAACSAIGPPSPYQRGGNPASTCRAHDRLQAYKRAASRPSGQPDAAYGTPAESPRPAAGSRIQPRSGRLAPPRAASSLRGRPTAPRRPVLWVSCGRTCVVITRATRQRVNRRPERPAPARSRSETAMFTHPHIASQIAHERQRDMLAQASQQRLARQLRHLARSSRHTHRAGRPVTRVLRRIRPAPLPS